MRVTNMDCREGRAVLSSGGGAVAIDSLDGRCDVDSAGGDVQARRPPCGWRGARPLGRRAALPRRIHAAAGRLTPVALHPHARAPQIQLHDNAGAVSVRSGGGGITLFLSPGTVGRLRLHNCARVAGRPGLVRLAQPQDDGSLELQLPLGAGAAAAAAVAGHAPQQQQQAQPVSRLQRAAQGAPPPPGNAVTSASRRGPAGADIVLDAGGWAGGCMDWRHAMGLIAGGASCRPAPCIPRAPVRLLNPAGGSGTITVSERSWMDALRHKHR